MFNGKRSQTEKDNFLGWQASGFKKTDQSQIFVRKISAQFDAMAIP